MLAVSDLDVFYGKLQVLWGASLRVERKEIVAVIGPNGAGKTTLLKAVVGVLNPSSGEIRFGGNKINGLPAHKITGLGIGLVPEGRELFPKMSVQENLFLGAYHSRNGQDVRDSLEWVYGIFPVLKERVDQSAGTLSGGEQQMLAIGRALMSRPKLLMLDEPTVGLAPTLVLKVFDVIQRLRDEGVTILTVEQNVHHILNIADRGYVLEAGRVVLVGPGKDLLDSPHVAKAYLGR